MSNGMGLHLILMWHRLIYGDNLVHSLLIRKKDMYRALSEKKNWSCVTLKMADVPILVMIAAYLTYLKRIFCIDYLSCDLKNRGPFFHHAKLLLIRYTRSFDLLEITKFSDVCRASGVKNIFFCKRNVFLNLV